MAASGRDSGRWRGSSSHERGGSRPYEARQRKPCRHFLNNQSCKFGEGCRFSHEPRPVKGEPPPPGSSASKPAGDEQEGRRYNDWKRLILRMPHAQGIDKSTLRAIWSGAPAVLDGASRERHQQLVKDIVDDKFFGCYYLHQTLNMRFASHGGCDVAIVEDFLRTITHPAILDCLSIDTYVGTLYNIISGARGNRAVAFFLDFCQGLLDCSHKASTREDFERLDRCLAAMLDAMAQLLTREKLVSFNDDLPALFDLMDDMFNALDAATEALSGPYSARRDRLSTLRRIVGLSFRLLTHPDDQEQGNGPSNIPLLPLWPIEMPVPGGRHDNDHMEIADISIFPTTAEITSEQPEYLPSTDFRQPHFHAEPLQRHIDTHFRLLRQDIFGPLKAVLSMLMPSIEGGLAPRLPKRDVASVHLYQHACIEHVAIHEKRGFEISLSFSLPQQLRGKTADERRRWWETSKRLEPGNLVCMLCSQDTKADPLLLIVSEKCTSSPKGSSKGPKPDSNARSATVVARLAALRQKDLQLAVQLYRKRTRGILVGVPGILPATFTPILGNLQQVIRTGELPLGECIVPNPSAANAAATDRIAASLSPPRYAQRPGFLFPLHPILKDKSNDVSLSVTAAPDDPALLDQLQDRTSLDRGQCSALICALTREFALIQGPPGTGKSYLGVQLIQVLLACKKAASLGPIIVICYTNHALDQFLLGLLNAGMHKIIRIGGQSRSPEMESYNLRTISASEHKTGHENYIVGSTYSSMEDELKRAGKQLSIIHQMRKGQSWGAQKSFLQKNHIEIYGQLYRDVDDDGFKMAHGRDPLETWAGRKSKFDQAAARDGPGEEDFQTLEARAAQDVHSLTPAERNALSGHWLDELQRDQVERLFVDLKHAEELHGELNSVYNEVNRRALLKADIIGITTTGLAKDIGTLQKLRSKVVVCEEAAEVLEAHIISALMPGIEHFIQIGDHRQLRPQINNYDLSLESTAGQLYQLDRSQFERLATGQPGFPALPIAQLSVQRRMRPEIAQLIRTTVYPNLVDHDAVRGLPDVAGMGDNVFWLDHGHTEDASTDDGRVKSHSNEWEAAMTKALVRHLVRQGSYRSTDIAVLTPYTGQLNKLRASLSSDFEISLSDRDEETLAMDGFNEGGGGDGDGDESERPAGGRALRKARLSESLRLATVDNFQGEEAKVVVVSLVRSNSEGRVGFLRTENRINVLLSRAQHGMYLIGSADTYGGVAMWAEVRRQLEAAGRLGRALKLRCPRHSDQNMECAEPDDFARLSPEGGCGMPCGWRLDRCGHQCLAKCHSAAMHAIFPCPMACARRRAGCQHACPKLCGEDCGPCRVLIDGVRLPCGHDKDGVPCFRLQEWERKRARAGRPEGEVEDSGEGAGEGGAGIEARAGVGVGAALRCLIQVEKRVADCGHVLAVPCWLDVGSSAFECPKPCAQVLECGHECRGSCGGCGRGGGGGRKGASASAQHNRCQRPCGRPRSTCSHTCDVPCHDGEPCGPCKKQCEVRCAHSRCILACADACAPCIEKCAWSCVHQGDCSMPCAAPCDRLPCDVRCSRRLACGHGCPGLCGEPCPEGYCQLCGGRGDDRVDLIELRPYRDIDLDETPVVVLSCGHFFTAESLDGLARLGDVYAVDAAGRYCRPLEPSAAVPVPSCPDCKRPIKQFATARYNRVVNAAVMDEILRKFVVKGQTELQSLEQRVEAEAETLRQTRGARQRSLARRPLAHGVSPGRSLQGRYEGLQNLETQAAKFCKTMSVEQQPSKKLFDAILEAKARRPLEGHVADVSLENLQQPALECRAELGGRLALLRIQVLLLQDWLGLGAEVQQLEAPRLRPRPDAPDKVKKLLVGCERLVEKSRAGSLPRYAVMGILAHACVAQSLRESRRSRTEDAQLVSGCVATARRLLEEAGGMCGMPFEGAQQLGADVEAAKKLLGSEWYETVTAEELAAIKLAMVSGPRGISTHSGHWYKCSNGHAFAIGECGMPMQLARCPECGAQIGGRDHELVPGVSRAEDMEG